jgi:site-specific recombinase XerD
LPYEFLLPSIKHEKKLPVVLSKEEVWAMLQNAKLLKHRILIGLLYGCGLRCMEARSVRLRLDFDRKQLKVVQGKVKDRYVPLSEHLIRGLKNTSKPKNLKIIFNGQPLPTGAGGDFDNRYSQRGVQWAVKQVAKAAGIIKEVHTHTLTLLCHAFAGMDIMTLKDLWDIKC